MNTTETFDFLPFAGFLFILALLFWRILFLKKKGIQVGSKNGKKNKTTILLFPVFLLFFLIWFYEITKPVFHFSFSLLPEVLTGRLSESILLNIAGAVLISFSLILLLTTLIHFKTSLRFGLDENNKGKLVTTGVFSISRNPFFLSLVLYFTGVAFVSASLFFIGFAILSMAGIHFFILKEEKFMREVYREEYKKYAEKVRRYF